MSLSEHASVLVVDDDAVFRDRLAKTLSERGFEVRTAGDVPQALVLAQADPPELAVVDLRMPGPSGLTLVDALLALDAQTRIVVLTGWGSVSTAVDAMQRGAAHYLQKPVTVDELMAALLGTSPSSPSPSSSSNDPAIPSLARAEWEYIHKVLAECHDNISEAARRLGLHRRSLQRKLQKFPPSQ